MPRPHKKQHKVPKIYLEAFTNEDGRVWVADDKLRLFSDKPKKVLEINNRIMRRSSALVSNSKAMLGKATYKSAEVSCKQEKQSDSTQ